jgi:hypothetical protein
MEIWEPKLPGTLRLSIWYVGTDVSEARRAPLKGQAVKIEQYSKHMTLLLNVGNNLLTDTEDVI